MMLKACFLGLIIAFCALLLKNLGWRGAPALVALGIVLLLSELPLFFSEARELFEPWSSSLEGASAIFKIIGIGYLFGVCSEICLELGERGVASALILVGRLEAVGVALPFIYEIFALALSLVS